MFSWYKYLIVSLVFSHLGFWSGNLFLIAPFPDLCLLVPFSKNLSYIITRATDSSNCAISPQLAITGTVEFDIDDFQNRVFDVRRRHLPLLE